LCASTNAVKLVPACKSSSYFPACSIWPLSNTCNKIPALGKFQHLWNFSL
jgi:hypothetical protein